MKKEIRRGLDVADTRRQIEGYRRIIKEKQFTKGYRNSCEGAIKDLKILLKREVIKRGQEKKEPASSKRSGEKSKELGRHIGSILKINNQEFYLTVSSNREGGGYIALSDEEAQDSVLSIGDFNIKFGDEAGRKIRPALEEINKFFQLIKKRLEEGN